MKNSGKPKMILVKFKNKDISGFTIVELLVVIVVIGILAALAVASYSGVTQKAREASLQSDLSASAKKLKLYNAQYGTYPTSMDLSTGCPTAPTPTTDPAYCVKTSQGNTLSSYTGSTNDFNLSVANSNGLTYKIDQTGVPNLVLRVLAFSEGSGGQICYIASDNKAYCIGDNSYGMLGNGTTTASSTPVPVTMTGSLSGKSFKQLSATGYNTCGVASDDQAYCWGYGGYSMLGSGTYSDALVPVAVSTSGVLSGKTIKSVHVGGLSSPVCALASDNNGYCWGLNQVGDLGNGNTSSSAVPVAVNTSGVLSGKTLKAIDAGREFACAIASDDQVYCWGKNNNGQLGNNSTTNSSVPVAVFTGGALSGKTVKSLVVGLDFSCVIASDNLPYCWGYNTFGSLGNNSTTNSTVPVAVNSSGVLSGKTVKSIITGYYHTCAIASDNLPYCWGWSSEGGLGNNSTSTSSVPVAVSTSGVLSGKTINTIASKGNAIYVIASDNNVYYWGAGSLVPVVANIP